MAKGRPEYGGGECAPKEPYATREGGIAEAGPCTTKKGKPGTREVKGREGKGPCGEKSHPTVGVQQKVPELLT